MRRLAAVTLVLCGSAGLAPAPAGAHSLVRSGGGLVSYTSADATSLNTLLVRGSAGRVEFRDDSVDGGMDPGSCTPGELGAGGYIVQTFCALDGVRRVRIDLGEREDSASVALAVPVTLLGGAGADQITGGEAADELSGGEGNDVVGGGPGDDVLSGDQGADALSGGDGADRIAARDGSADSISCGPGADTVDADNFDTLAADCEGVSRIATEAPAADADDGKPPVVDVGAPTLQELGRSRLVRVYATSSERGTLSASGSLEATGLALPIKRIGRERVNVGGGGAVLTYRLAGRHWRLASRTLRRGKPVVVRLGVVATDLSGRSRRRDAPPIVLARAGEAGPSAVFGPLARAAHPEPGDVDGDGVRDEVDNCPLVRNGSQLNTDRSTEPVPGTPGTTVLGDACDDDDDADGIPDLNPPGPDNCRVVFNPTQQDTDGDGRGDACPAIDRDADGVLDEDDNCDLIVNPDQQDLDGDDFGDSCDNDDDGDTFRDPYDNCPTVYNLEPTDVNGDGYLNDQLDRDGDRIGTACDPEEPIVSGPPPSQPPSSGAPADTRRPGLIVGVERRHRLAAVKAGLVVRLRCSEACGATVELHVSRTAARRLGLRQTAVLAGGSVRLQAAGNTYAFVRFDGRARRALFRMRRLSTKMTAQAVDGSGNRRGVSRRVELLR